MDIRTFDPRTASPDVQEALARYLRIIIYGGGDGGGIPAAEWDCKQELQQLGYDEPYIEAATTYAWSIGDAEWHRRYRAGLL